MQSKKTTLFRFLFTFLLSVNIFVRATYLQKVSRKKKKTVAGDTDKLK